MLRYLANGRRDFLKHPDYPAKRLNWDFFALHSGKVRLVTDDRLIKMPPGANFWVIAPGVRYCWKAEGRPCVRSVFSFSHVPFILREEVERTGVLARRLGKKDLRQIAELAENIRDDFANLTQFSPLIFERALIDLTLLILQGMPLRLSTRLDELNRERVEQAIAWFAGHMDQFPKVSSVAQACNLSESHMRHLFLEVLRSKPHEVFTQLQIQRACEFLATTSMTLDEIAVKCGFRSVSDFCRVFSRLQRISPNVWRRKVSERPDAVTQIQPLSLSAGISSPFTK